MKVLIAGESSIHLQNYCRAIRPLVKELILLTETPVKIPEADRHHVISFRSFNPLAWWLNSRKIGSLIRKENPDLIHVHQINRLAYFVSRNLNGKPLISTAWGSDVLLVPERGSVYKDLVRQVLRQSRFITADANSMIDAMMKLEPVRDKYIQLQYGIDLVKTGVKEKIIYSNRNHKPLYRIGTILHLFSEFSKQHPDWALHIGGAGPETVALKKEAANLGLSGKVRFLGWLDQQQNHDEYSKAAIYISIPESDGTSVSLLEAMSAGCIPVVSDLPSNREWVEDKRNGVIWSHPSNPFLTALQLKADECERINRSLISERADRRSTTAVFYELYKKALNR